MNIKDTSLIGPSVDKWNATYDKVAELDIATEDIIAKQLDLIEEVKILNQKLEALLFKQQQAKQTKSQPSVVNSINVDLGAEYNCYLTNIFVVYSSKGGSPTEPVFFKDANNEQVLLEWHEFSEFYTEFVYTVLESQS
jgi:uncharacterized protein (UPF0371 family)